MEMQEMEKNLFFIAARDGYTFETPKGYLTLHDLFKIPVPIKDTETRSNTVTLDDLATCIDKLIKDKSGVSFVRKNKETNEITVLKNKLEILKLVIEYRISKYEEKMNLLKDIENKKRKLAKIDAAIEQKETEDLSKLSVEELQKLKETL